VLAGGCGVPSARRNEEFLEDFRYPWNAPTNVEAARRRPPPIHLGDPYVRRPALSPDGSLLAATLPASSVNEMAIIDLRSRRGWFLSHPNYRVKLTHPTFSPDGRWLAMVVTPPTYYGASEIWITGPEGGSALVIATNPSGCFMLPAFSQDNTRLVCFNDANAAGDQMQWGRSYRTGLVQLALYEVEIASRRVNRLTQQAWSWVNAVAYSPDVSGFYLSTGRQSILRQDSEGRLIWEAAAAHLQADVENRYAGLSGYFCVRGDEPSASPRPLAPLLDSEAGEFCGVDRSGTLLLRYPRPNPLADAGVSSGLLSWNGRNFLDRIVTPQAHIQEGAISNDGSVAVGRATIRYTEGRDTSLSPRQCTYYLGRGSNAITQLSAPDDIQFELSRKPIEPVDPTEMI
jgi:hypothetical protein